MLRGRCNLLSTLPRRRLLMHRREVPNVATSAAVRPPGATLRLWTLLAPGGKQKPTPNGLAGSAGVDCRVRKASTKPTNTELIPATASSGVACVRFCGNKLRKASGSFNSPARASCLSLVSSACRRPRSSCQHACRAATSVLEADGSLEPSFVARSCCSCCQLCRTRSRSSCCSRAWAWSSRSLVECASTFSITAVNSAWSA
mmetsp:Transcript_125547/g.250467  ORF Transcript_125547/g.250467 Transcript_125547/m.250467 type:complete len:202 (+) Transcript_125547:81-686(+)